jgi:hypothetical protein
MTFDTTADQGRTGVFLSVAEGQKVSLARNTNPVYTRLDPNDPGPAFAAALEQLKAWGFDVAIPEAGRDPVGAAARASGTANASARSTHSSESLTSSLERALSLVPRPQHGGAAVALALIVVPAPREVLLRPSELEDPSLAGWLEREALYGEPPVLERGEGTRTGVIDGHLVARQSQASVAVDEEGALVVVRPLTRGADRSVVLRGIIEEDVLADLEADLAFADRIIAHIDPAGRTSHIIPVVALIGAGYTAWRTRAEQAASPNMMSMNMNSGDQIVTHLSSPAQPRSALGEGRSNLAMDLMVLLRRAGRTA